MVTLRAVAKALALPVRLAAGAALAGSVGGELGGCRAGSAAGDVSDAGPGTSGAGVGGGSGGDGGGSSDGAGGTSPPPGGTSSGGLLVTTTLGPVAGALDQGVPAFRGIPFAAPPVGSLRWRAPQPMTPWTTPRDASAFAQTCIQLDTDGTLLPGGGEDCLTLNVWTPSTTTRPAGVPGGPGAPLPVLVFFHGGYFVKGGATYTWHDEEVYDGAQLATRANAVVVTVQYRLGAFGFLAHPALSLPEAPHGNYGLLDQIQALHFVQDNAARFGGDPGTVTIFGQSAGGSSVAALLASPLAAHLFSRAIIESGGFNGYSVATGTSDASIVSTSLGCTTAADVAGCLRSADASAVAVSLPNSALGANRWHFLDDGYALRADPQDLFAAGTWNQVPVLLGNNRDELSAIVYDYLRAANLAAPTDQPSYESDVAAFYPSDTAAVLALYPFSAYASAPTSGIAQLLADDQYTCPTRAAARALATSGQPVFRYLFTHALDADDFDGGAGSTAMYGAYHFLEVPFVFHTLTPGDFVFDTPEFILSAEMIDMWSTFAGTGSPSSPSLPWPAYPSSAAAQATSDPYMAIDVISAAGDGVRTSFCDFWDTH